jgi:transposase
VREQSFQNRYGFSAVSPIKGTSFHLTGIDGFDSEASYVFLTELKKQHPDRMVILVWDNAPCHRPMTHRQIPGLIIIFLPPYSPQLNPCERFFGELRKATANTIFKTIDEQEEVLNRRINELSGDMEGMKRLLGHDWIVRQVEEVS